MENLWVICDFFLLYDMRFEGTPKDLTRSSAVLLQQENLPAAFECKYIIYLFIDSRDKSTGPSFAYRYVALI